MSEYKHTISKDGLGTTSGAPNQAYSNAGQGLANRSLTVNNGAIIAVAATSGKQIISTLYGATVDQIGNAQLNETLDKASRGLGYVLIGFVNPALALGKVAVDVTSQGVKRAIEYQDIRFDNEYKQATSGVNTSLEGFYG